MKKFENIFHGSAGTKNAGSYATGVVNAVKAVGRGVKKVVKSYADKIENVERLKSEKNLKMKRDLESGDYLHN